MTTGNTGAHAKAGRGTQDRRAPRTKDGQSQEKVAAVGNKRRSSAYGRQLAEKESVKSYYGVREAQFKRFFKEALRQREMATGEALLSMLERRLDNVIFSLKLATTRRQARQMIVHRHVKVNGKTVKSPSYLVGVGDVVSFAESTLGRETFVQNAIDKRLNIGIKVPEWLELRKKDRSGVVLRRPERADVGTTIEEHLIVELYSK